MHSPSTDLPSRRQKHGVNRRFKLRPRLFFFVLLAVGAIAVSCARTRLPQDPPTTGEPDPGEPPVVKTYSPLTGLEIAPEQSRQRVLAVMIDNNPMARPQTGLDQAQIVYEALAEGGITRFMALYLEGNPDEIGPVRSARHYFVRWAMEYEAIIAHAGVSPQAGHDIADFNVASLDDIRGQGNFYRKSGRQPPHNLYNSVARLREDAKLRGFSKDSPVGPGWTYSTLVSPAGASTPTSGGASPGQKASILSIPYPKGWNGYTVIWRYDQASGTYLREMAGRVHSDAASGEQLSAKSVLVQYVKTWAIPGDDKLRIDMELTGTGEGLLVSGGLARKVVWQKASASTRTVWTEEDGRALVLEPGNVWVQVVPLETKVVVTE